MKIRHATILALSFLFIADAHAFFFIFIPGSVTQKISDSITGSKGSLCVKESATVDQVLTSTNGNTLKILSLSGTSSLCKNPALPIRADFELIDVFQSKAGIELPDDYEAAELSPYEHYAGWVLKTTFKNDRNRGVQISTVRKSMHINIHQMANNIERAVKANGNLKDVITEGVQEFSVLGHPSVRFEMAATLSGIFGRRVRYIYTVIEGEDEHLVVTEFCNDADTDKLRPDFEKFLLSLKGLGSTEAVSAVEPVQTLIPEVPAPVPSQAEPTVR